MINVEKIYNDFNIQYWAFGKNVSPGWINIRCPFCHDSSNHLGYNQKKGYYNCWKCGHHSEYDVIKNILKESPKKILEKYNIRHDISKKLKSKSAVKKESFLLIGKEMLSFHIKYLQKRGFDAELLKEKYNLLGTNHIGDYKFRIIAPIFFRGQIVSFQGRDATDKQAIRYKACSKEKEIIHHKHILYNMDNAKEDWVIVVEGITDVWRLGNNSVATFGTEYTKQQLKLLSQRYKKVFLFFDKEIEAQRKAVDLSFHLDALGVETNTIFFSQFDDPASMDEKSVVELKKNIKKALLL